ncbi:hypothetical protein BKA61DRAFT_696479 [Leptodontidium sp. MPI-SDFR-AT-0119]|nr:hypothetical protein BKA61DRAFT_696479 [Leptodontidium sp. MPI-SDFR-AT-0119]
MIDGLVPSLFAFFSDIQYLKLCMDCLKRLLIVPKRESVYETLARTYSDKNQREGHVKIQITEDSFLDRAGTPADCVDLGIRQLVALAMRYYPAMPADPVKEGPVRIAPTKADTAVLRSLADLAYDLGFDTPQIRALKKYPSLRTARLDSSPLPPLYVTFVWTGCSNACQIWYPPTSVGIRDATVAIVMYLKAKQDVSGEPLKRSTLLGYYRAGRSHYLDGMALQEPLPPEEIQEEL